MSKRVKIGELTGSIYGLQVEEQRIRDVITDLLGQRNQLAQTVGALQQAALQTAEELERLRADRGEAQVTLDELYDEMIEVKKNLDTLYYQNMDLAGDTLLKILTPTELRRWAQLDTALMQVDPEIADNLEFLRRSFLNPGQLRTILQMAGDFSAPSLQAVAQQLAVLTKAFNDELQRGPQRLDDFEQRLRTTLGELVNTLNIGPAQLELAQYLVSSLLPVSTLATLNSTLSRYGNNLEEKQKYLLRKLSNYFNSQLQILWTVGGFNPDELTANVQLLRQIVNESTRDIGLQAPIMNLFADIDDLPLETNLDEKRELAIDSWQEFVKAMPEAVQEELYQAEYDEDVDIDM